MFSPKNHQKIIAGPQNQQNLSPALLSPVLNGPKKCRPSLYTPPVLVNQCAQIFGIIFFWKGDELKLKALYKRGQKSIFLYNTVSDREIIIYTSRVFHSNFAYVQKQLGTKNGLIVPGNTGYYPEQQQRQIRFFSAQGLSKKGLFRRKISYAFE